MKILFLRCSLVFAVASLLLLTTHSVLAQTTAFTYQGSLVGNGAPASGSFDFQFTVYDASTNGNVVGSPLTNAATAVSNGLFTAQLDFGAGVFTGAARWLQIGVRTNTSTGVTLSGTFNGNGTAQTKLNPSALSDVSFTAVQTNVYSSFGTYNFTVPAQVTKIVVKLWGAAGGSFATEATATGGAGGLDTFSTGGQASSLFYFSGTVYIMKAEAGGVGGSSPGQSGSNGNNYASSATTTGLASLNLMGGYGGGGGMVLIFCFR